MSLFRRLRNFVRVRRVLAAGAFVFVAYLFANNLPPEARYSVRTGVKSVHEFPNQSGRPGSPWGTSPTTAGRSRSGFTGMTGRGCGGLPGWNCGTCGPARTGRPPTGPSRPGTASSMAASGTTARASGRCSDSPPGGCSYSTGKPGPPSATDCSPRAFGSARTAVTLVPVRLESSGEGTAVDDLRTGRRVATLPDATEKLTVARTAGPRCRWARRPTRASRAG